MDHVSGNQVLPRQNGPVEDPNPAGEEDSPSAGVRMARPAIQIQGSRDPAVGKRDERRSGI